MKLSGNVSVVDDFRRSDDETLGRLVQKQILLTFGKSTSSEACLHLEALRRECARRSEHLYDRLFEGTAAAIRAELDKVLNSSYFNHKKRGNKSGEATKRTKPGQMLSYIVNGTIQGQILKELEIGTAIFKRAPAYDSAADNIVRVQAGKLRRNLRKYYSTKGRSDAIKIEVPKGRYVAVFLPHRDHSLPKPERSLKLVPLTGHVGSEIFPNFSTDGNKIVFCWNGEKEKNYNLYVKDLVAEKLCRITSRSVDDVSPVWSPTNKRIAFFRLSPTDSSIWLVSPNGKGERELARVYPVRFEVLGRQLAWHPKGTYLGVVDKESSHLPFSIYYQEVSGKQSRHQITRPPLEFVGDSDPVFSPDGNWLAFIRTASVGVKDVYVMRLQSREIKRVTTDNTYVSGVDWSPDGRHLVFSSTRTGTPSLWTISFLRGTPKLVSGVSGDAVYPSVSSRHARMTYMQMSMNTDIWQLSLRTPSTATALIQSTRHDIAPQFSPDGKRIAFASNRRGSLEIWLCEKDGSNQVELTSFRGTTGAGSPRWSPDGSQIVFDCRKDGEAHVYTIPSHGGTPIKLTSTGTENVVPSWSRTGWIYFASNRKQGVQIWKMRPSGSEAVQVTEGGGFAPVESADGRFVYYSKGRTEAGVWRVPVDGGHEASVLPSPPQGFWGYWTIMEDGIYFLDFKRENLSLLNVISNASLSFLDFSTDNVSLKAEIADFRTTPYAGISVSPDHSLLLYTQLDRPTSNIILAENYA